MFEDLPICNKILGILLVFVLLAILIDAAVDYLEAKLFHSSKKHSKKHAGQKCNKAHNKMVSD